MENDIKTAFERVDEKFDQVFEYLQGMGESIDGLNKNVGDINNNIGGLTKDLDDLKKLSAAHSEEIVGLAEHIDKRFEKSLEDTKKLIDQRLNTFAGTHGLVLRDAPKGSNKRKV